MRISDWSSDVCSSDLRPLRIRPLISFAQCRDLMQEGLIQFAKYSDGPHKINVRRRTYFLRFRPAFHQLAMRLEVRSEESSAGKECVSKCRSRGSPYHSKNNNKTTHSIPNKSKE